MDKNRQSPKRPPGRKITSDYDWEGLEKRVYNERNSGYIRNSSRNAKTTPYVTSSEKQLKRENDYHRSRSRRRVMTKKLRSALILVLAAAIVIILVLMTPIFNIKSIKISGNNTVSLDEIKGKLEDLADENLFRVSKGNIKKRLKDIAYIEDADISRGLFPPGLNIVIRECEPAGYMKLEEKNIIINSELKVLRDDDTLPTDAIPRIYGIDVKNYHLGRTIETEETEKAEILKEMLDMLSRLEIINKINYIDINELTGIKMLYDDRLEILCGTRVDMERKLRILKETVTNNYINENSRGTIDLSVSGKAVYTP